MKRKRIIFVLSFVIFLLLLVFHYGAIHPLPGSRVEVLCGDSSELPAELIQASPEYHGDRLVIPSSDLFTAQRAESATGGTVLDYSWADEVLLGSATIWTAFGAMLLLLLITRLLYRQAKSEVLCAKAERKGRYLCDYLKGSGIRLLAKAVAAVLCVLLSGLLVQYLISYTPSLPAAFLPQDTLFDSVHYCTWFERTFPSGSMSAYAENLLRQLKAAYACAAAECLMLTAMTVCVM